MVNRPRKPRPQSPIGTPSNRSAPSRRLSLRFAVAAGAAPSRTALLAGSRQNGRTNGGGGGGAALPSRRRLVRAASTQPAPARQRSAAITSVDAPHRDKRETATVPCGGLKRGTRFARGTPAGGHHGPAVTAGAKRCARWTASRICLPALGTRGRMRQAVRQGPGAWTLLTHRGTLRKPRETAARGPGDCPLQRGMSIGQSRTEAPLRRLCARGSGAPEGTKLRRAPWPGAAYTTSTD